MPGYKVITESAEKFEGVLNEHAREGWKLGPYVHQPTGCYRGLDRGHGLESGARGGSPPRQPRTRRMSSSPMGA
jgi:hypothetical protein